MVRKNPLKNSLFDTASEFSGNNSKFTLPNLPQKESEEERLLDYISDKELIDIVDSLLIKKEDWKHTHPASLACGSDKYYADLANMIMLAIAQLNLPSNMPFGFAKELAMSTAAYLEDLVSGFGVWNAFRALHKKKYGKWIPFYDCAHEEYLLDNVNIEDLKFIVWQTFCRCGQPEERIFSPYSEGVEKIPEILYDMIVDRFEYAPEAKRVTDYIRKTLRKGDYYEVRSLGEWLVLDNKLMSAPNAKIDMIEEAKRLSESYEELGIELSIYYIKSIKAWTPYCGQMGCRSSLYLAEMARELGFEALASKLENLQTINTELFKVNRSIKDDIILEDISGEEFIVDKKSFRKGSQFRDVKGYLTSLVKFGDKWVQNGVATALTENPFEKIENPMSQHMNDKMRELMHSVAEKHGGRRIFYCKNMEEVSSILGVSYIGVSYKGEKTASSEDYDNLVLMISFMEGPSLLKDDAQCFKDKSNPFYSKRVASKEALFVVAGGNVPEDIASIIVENDMLPDAQMNAMQGKWFGKKIVQENMGFLFDFFRTKNPEIDVDD